MNGRQHRDGRRKSIGFTIVEVLIGIVLIGILAGLTFFSYEGWRNRIAEMEVKSDLNGVYSAMEDARNFGNRYPNGIPNSFRASEDVTVTYVSGDDETYCVEAQSKVIISIRYHVNANGRDPQEGECVVSLSTPVISDASVDGAVATLSWNSITAATGYDVQRRIGTGAWVTTSTNATSITLSGLNPGNVYQFQVRSKDSNAVSGWSPIVQRAVVPTPTISSVTLLRCGNSGGIHSWLDGQVSWTATTNTITASYLLRGDVGLTYGNSPKSITNTVTSGSSALSSIASTTRWEANHSASGMIYLYGVGPNGELSTPAIWTSGTYPPYHC